MGKTGEYERRWETDAELLTAARWRYLNDPHVHAIADVAAHLTVPDGGNASMTAALREVAIQAVAVALLVHEGPPHIGRSAG